MKKCNFLFVLILIFLFQASNAQNVQQVEASQGGVFLKKVVSDTVIQTGQPFTYYIYFTVPANVYNMRITDILPAGVVFKSISVPNGIGNPTVTTPAVDANGTVLIQWVLPELTPLPASYSGIIAITVSFPNGITCNNTVARNSLTANWSVCDRGPACGQTLTTSAVTTKAKAVNPWRIVKYPIGVLNNSGTCRYATADSIVNYYVYLYKDVGTTGQLNLVNGVITDVLPPGATLVSTNLSSPTVTQVGNTLQFNVGNLSALPLYNYSAFWNFKIRYPSSQTTFNNKATLTGTLGRAEIPCGTINISDSVCIAKVQPVSNITFGKYAYTSGQPGCGGRYYIFVNNTGTQPVNVVIRDTVPSTIQVQTPLPTMSGFTSTIVGNIITYTSTSTIAGGSGGGVYFDFTIPSNAVVGSTITNCASIISTTTTAPITTLTRRSCASFVLSAPVAKACLWKEVCNKKTTYTIGETIRYRLRVQNIGGVPINAGAVVSDVLNSNLVYAGNATFNTSSAWNQACNSTSSNWGNVTTSVNGNTINFNLPSIAAVCQSTFFPNCGAYGTASVPFYFIEFDAKVVDTAALGNTPNNFTISGGGLVGTTTSNSDLVTIVGNLALNAIKEVSNSDVWSNTLTANAGALINYRLRTNISAGSIGLRHVSFVDLLPQNVNGTSDSYILAPCFNRGSNFGITLNSTNSSTPTSLNYSNAGAYASVNLFNPTPFSSVLYTGCGTSTNNWASSQTLGDRNLGYYFGTNPIGTTSPASIIFSARINANAALNANACNTFAVTGFVKHLFNTSSTGTTSFVSTLPVESPTACVTIVPPVNPEICLAKLAYDASCKGKDVNGNQTYSISINGTYNNPNGTQISLSSGQGNFDPSTFNTTSGGFNLSTLFTNLPPYNSNIVVYLTLLGKEGKICKDSIKIELPRDCPVEEDCCTSFLHTVETRQPLYDPITNEVYLNGCFNAGPNKIQKFKYQIVSAERQVFCNERAQPKERIFGDIIYSDLSIPMFPGTAQTLTNFTREVNWGKFGECFDFNNESQCFKSVFVFTPPPSSCEQCYDVLKFGIRYTFTDCNCVTCDTVIYYEVTRRCNVFTKKEKKNETNIGLKLFEKHFNEINKEKFKKIALVKN
jgi:uncharacterized repeat protein (TIGR01451 family)